MCHCRRAQSSYETNVLHFVDTYEVAFIQFTQENHYREFCDKLYRLPV